MVTADRDFVRLIPGSLSLIVGSGSKREWTAGENRTNGRANRFRSSLRFPCMRPPSVSRLRNCRPPLSQGLRPRCSALPSTGSMERCARECGPSRPSAPLPSSLMNVASERMRGVWPRGRLKRGRRSSGSLSARRSVGR